MFVPLLLAPLLTAVQVSLGATITLYNPIPSGVSYINDPSPAEYTVKAIGTGTNGEVTLVEHEVVTATFSVSFASTSTTPLGSLVLEPIPTVTREDTIVQGPSTWALHLEPTAAPFTEGHDVSCSTDGEGKAVCVDLLYSANPGESATKTLTATYTASLAPVYTFVTDASNDGKSLRREWSTLGVIVLSLATALGATITLL